MFKSCVESDPLLRPSSRDLFQRVRDFAVHQGLVTTSAAHYTSILVHGSETQSCGSPLNSARTSVFSSPYGRMSSFCHAPPSPRSPRAHDPWARREGSQTHQGGGVLQWPLHQRRPPSETQRSPLGGWSWQASQHTREALLQEELAIAQRILGTDGLVPNVYSPPAMSRSSASGLPNLEVARVPSSEALSPPADTARLPWELQSPPHVPLPRGPENPLECALSPKSAENVCARSTANQSAEASTDGTFRVHSLLSLAPPGNRANTPAAPTAPQSKTAALERAGSLLNAGVSDSSSSLELPEERGPDVETMRRISEGQLRLLGSSNSGSLGGRPQGRRPTNAGSVNSSSSFNLELGASANLAKILCKLQGTGMEAVGVAAVHTNQLSLSSADPVGPTRAAHSDCLLNPLVLQGSGLTCNCEGHVGGPDGRVQVKWLDNAIWDPDDCRGDFQSAVSEMHSQGMPSHGNVAPPAVLLQNASASGSCTLTLPGRMVPHSASGSASMPSPGGCT